MRRILGSIIEYEAGLPFFTSSGFETGISDSAAGAILLSILITNLLRLEFRSGNRQYPPGYFVCLDAYTRKKHLKSQELPTDFRERTCSFLSRRKLPFQTRRL